MRHQRLLLGLSKPFLDGFFDPREAGSVLVFSQFADAAHAPVTQVVDVVNVATAVAQIHQDFDD